MSELVTNTASLQAILDIINTLPQIGVGNESALTLCGSGTFTGNGSGTYTLAHGLGVTPKAIVLLNTSHRISEKYYGPCVMLRVGDTTFYTYYCLYYSTGINAETHLVSDAEWNNETLVLKLQAGVPGQSFASGYQYSWKAFV